MISSELNVLVCSMIGHFYGIRIYSRILSVDAGINIFLKVAQKVMALNTNRELANKKLLEELELNKKLLKQGGVPTLNSQNSLQTGLNPQNKKPLGLHSDVPVLSATQRSALNLARTQSYGYYIPQDSSFGNLILPVLPQFDDK